MVIAAATAQCCGVVLLLRTRLVVVALIFHRENMLSIPDNGSVDVRLVVMLRASIIHKLTFDCFVLGLFFKVTAAFALGETSLRGKLFHWRNVSVACTA